MPDRPEHVLGGAVRAARPRWRAAGDPAGAAPTVLGERGQLGRVRAAPRRAARRSGRRCPAGQRRRARGLPQPAQVEDGRRRRAARRAGPRRLPRPAAGRARSSAQERGARSAAAPPPAGRRAAGRRRTPRSARPPRTAPGAAARARTVDRTTTAISDHGTPSSRWARRRTVGQVGGLDGRGGEDVRPRPRRARCPRPAASRRCSHGPGQPSATFRLIRSSPRPSAGRRPATPGARRGRRCAGTGRGTRRCRAARRRGRRRWPGRGRRRRPGLAAAGEQLEQLDLGGVGVLVLVDEQPARPARAPGAAARGRRRAPRWPPDQLGRVVAGRVAPPGGRAGGDVLVLLLERAAGTQCSRPELLRPRRRAGRADAALGGAHQQLAELGGERPGRQGRARAAASGRRPPPRRRRRAARG